MKRKEDGEKKTSNIERWEKKRVEEWTEQCAGFKHTDIEGTS
jgi:hypothetical protein